MHTTHEPTVKAAPASLGLRGHMRLPPHVQKAIADLGLHIERRGAGYNRFYVPGYSEIDYKSLPDFLKNTRAPETGLYSLDGLEQLARYLHQPVLYSVSNGESDQKLNDLRRKNVHAVLRALTTGEAVLASAEHHDHLDESHNECHAEAEESMRDDEAWALRSEHQGLEEPAHKHGPDYNHAHSQQSPIAIPGLSYLGPQGWRIKFHSSVVSTDNNVDVNSVSKQIIQKILEILKDEGIEDLNAGLHRGQIDLPHDVFSRWLKNTAPYFDDGYYADLIKRAQLEKDVNEARQRIEQSAQKIALKNATHNLVTTSSFSGLLQASSALKPVLDSQAMRSLWGRFHVKSLTESPLDDVLHQISVMQETCAGLIDDRCSLPRPEAMQAALYEFYPVFGFLKSVHNAFQDSIEIQKRKNLTPSQSTALADLEQKLNQFSQVFEAANLPDFNLSGSFTDPDHAVLLEDLKRVIGQPGGFFSPAKRGLKGFFNATVGSSIEFFVDAKNALTETPATVATLAAVIALNVYANNFIGRDNQEKIPDGTVPVMVTSLDQFDESNEGLPIQTDRVYIPEAELPAQAPGMDANWHWDVGILGPYKHYVGGQVVGVSNTVIDGVRILPHAAYGQMGLPQNYNSSFEQSARPLVQPTADVMLGVNILQNFSHAAFWLYTLMLGYRHGASGLRRVGTLFAPLADVGYAAGRCVASIPLGVYRLGHKTLTGFDHQTKNLLSMTDVAGSLDFGQNRLHFSMNDRVSSDWISDQNSVIEASRVVFEVGGRQHDVSLTQERIQACLDVLSDLELKFDLIKLGQGALPEWHKAQLADTTKEVLEILKTAAYQSSSLSAKVEFIAGAEIRLFERSALLEQLGITLSELELKRVGAKAGHSYGTQSRTVNANRYLDALSGLDAQAQEPVKGLMGLAFNGAALCANRMGQGIAKTYRVTQSALSYVPAKRLGLATMGAGITVAVAIDLSAPVNDILPPMAAKIVDTTSSVAGVSTGVTVTASTFMAYNFVEDVLAVHVGMGGAFILMGAGVGFAMRRGVRPVTMKTLETFDSVTGINSHLAIDNAVQSIQVLSQGALTRLWQKPISEPITSLIQGQVRRVRRLPEISGHTPEFENA